MSAPFRDEACDRSVTGQSPWRWKPLTRSSRWDQCFITPTSDQSPLGLKGFPGSLPDHNRYSWMPLLGNCVCGCFSVFVGTLFEERWRGQKRHFWKVERHSCETLSHQTKLKCSLLYDFWQGHHVENLQNQNQSSSRLTHHISSSQFQQFLSVSFCEVHQCDVWTEAQRTSLQKQLLLAWRESRRSSYYNCFVLCTFIHCLINYAPLKTSAGWIKVSVNFESLKVLTAY